MGGKEQTDRCWGRECCSFAFPSFASKYKLHPVKALHLKSLTSTTDRHKNLSEKKISKTMTSEIIISHYICLRGKIFLYSFSYYMYFFKLNLIFHLVLLNKIPYITAERPNACKGTQQKLKTKKHYGMSYFIEREKISSIFMKQIFHLLDFYIVLTLNILKSTLISYSNVSKINPLETRLKLSHVSAPLIITPRFKMKLWLEWAKEWV